MAKARRIESQIGDKRLMGHVLAERYQSEPPTALDAAAWLAAYGDLPEAGDVYDAATAQGVQGLTKPAANDAWSGNDGSESALGFQEFETPGKSPAARNLAVKIDRDLRRDHPYAAKARLEAEQKKHPLPDNELGPIKGRLAAAFYYDGKTEEVRHFAYEAALQKDPLGLWMYGLMAWKQHMPAAAAMAFTQLAGQPALSSSDRAAASFWAWTATKRAGDAKNATLWLKQAASQPHSFYGFLASNLLGGDQPSWQLPAFSERNLAALTAQPAGWRALALVQIGRADLAEDELHHLDPQGQRDLQEAMLALAESTHMPSLALQLGGMATDDNGKPYDAALYPVPPWQPDGGFKVDRALIYALMRHQSLFDPEAVSGRGACGLLQVMPATAKLVTAQGVKTGDDAEGCPASLLDPATNMTLGQNYVKKLSRHALIGDNLVLLLAAYNGGPNRLPRWIDADTKKDPLLFIESLPLHETRDYVRQVLVHYGMYRARLSQPNAALAQLARGQWPHYVLNDGAPAGPRVPAKRRAISSPRTIRFLRWSAAIR